MSAQRNRTVVWGRQVFVGLAIVVGSVIVVGQSITVPNTFVNGTVADANQVNANFAALASNALNRNAGTMLGTLSSQAVTPTTDNSYDLGSATFAFRDAYVKRNTILNTVTYTWPGSQGSAGSLLQNNGSGTLSWATGGWTTVTTTSTGTQNDFALGSSGNTVLRCNNASLLTLTGIAGGVDGQHVLIESVGAGQVDLPHQSTSSTTAADRFINVATTAATSLGAGAGFAEIVYDGTAARWRLVNHQQGEWVSISGSSTITGWSSRTITHLVYWLQGRKLDVRWYLSGTSNVGSASFTIPFTSQNAGSSGDAGPGVAVAGVTIDNGSYTATPGQVVIFDSASTVSAFATMARGTWTTSGQKTTAGSLLIEVQ